MNNKLCYTAPEIVLVKLAAEQRILDGSVGTVTGNNVSGWNSEEENW